MKQACHLPLQEKSSTFSERARSKMAVFGKEKLPALVFSFCVAETLYFSMTTTQFQRPKTVFRVRSLVVREECFLSEIIRAKISRRKSLIVNLMTSFHAMNDRFEIERRSPLCFSGHLEVKFNEENLDGSML